MMSDTGRIKGPSREGKKSLTDFRHDIRNHLNAIKLSCALLRRRAMGRPDDESVREIERAADGINELVAQSLGDAEAPRLVRGVPPSVPRGE